MQLILASQSPRRKELLGLFHIPFQIRVADIDETMDPEKPAAAPAIWAAPSWWTRPAPTSR